MDRQHGTRRLILGALVVIVAATTALGTGSSASAADAKKIPDHGSKANFKATCELAGGTFKEDGLGNLECHYPNGSWTECDAKGNDCWHTPAALVHQGGDPFVGTIGEATSDVGGSEPSSPVADSPAPTVAQPIMADTPPVPSEQSGVAAPDEDQVQFVDKVKKGKKGKKGKHGGKNRKA